MLKKLAGIAMGALMATSVCAGAVAVAVGNDPVPADDTTSQTPVDDGYAAYLFVHFIGDGAGQEQLFFSVSETGTDWHTLNAARPVETITKQAPAGSTGGIRDPHIIRLHDDNPDDDQEPGYVIIATDLSIANIGGDWTASQNNGSTNIVIWKSNGNSLTDWQEPYLVNVGTDASTCVWAPESIWDEERQAYMVFWSSRTGNYDPTQRVYRAYTTDFVTFSKPELYIESDKSRIDTTFYYEDGVYYRFTKNEDTKKVYMEKSDSLSGNFKEVRTFRLDGKRYYEYSEAVEGPTVYKLNDGSGYCLLLDCWEYLPFETDDLATGDFHSAGTFDFGGVTFRHGSVIPIKQSEYDALMEKWDIPTEDQTETGNLVYHLDFEKSNLDVNTDCTQSSVAATAHGSITYDTGYHSEEAIKINGNNNYVELSGSLIKDKSSLTIAFAAKADSRSWMFYMAPNANNPENNKEHYLGGVLHVDNRIGEFKAERYHNTNGRPATATVTDLGKDWHHYVIVHHNFKTKIFIDGQLKAEAVSNFLINEMLGSNPVFYLGRAMWSGGEYSGNLLLDDFRVYDYALSDTSATELYNTVAQTGAGA